MKRKAFSPHDDVYIQYLRNMEKHDMPVQHYHDGYEIFLMLGGKRYLFYDNICFTLERGDMAVLRPFDIHYAQSRDAEYYERFVPVSYTHLDVYKRQGQEPQGGRK